MIRLSEGKSKPIWRLLKQTVLEGYGSRTIELGPALAFYALWVGAGSSGLLFLLGNHLIGRYLAAAGIASVYGAAGSMVIVLLWVYYSSQVVLFGAVAIRVYAKHRGAPLEPKANAVHVTRQPSA